METDNPGPNNVNWTDTIDTLCKTLGIHSLRPFQIEHGWEIVNGIDVFIRIATAQGKTLLLLLAMLVAQFREEDGIGLMVVPTKALAEQTEFTARKYHLCALSITEDTMREAGLQKPSRDLLGELFNSDGVRLGIMSPQMLRSTHIDKYLRVPKIKSRVRWMLIDEAHLVEDDTIFRVPFRNIAPLRAILPSRTVWVAVTGSATPNEARKIASTLGFQPGEFRDANYSLDRPNIEYSPRFLTHSYTTGAYLDLSFLIPFDMTSPQQIKPTIIFASSIQVGHAIMQYLDALIPDHIPNRLSIIKLYNSMMDLDYRRSFVQEFEARAMLRIAICTETLTYGFDISVHRVISFDLPITPNILKQQCGRAGRDGSPATFIAFAPEWLRDTPVAADASKQAKENAKRREKLPQFMVQWYNPTPQQCSRCTDLIHYGEILARDDASYPPCSHQKSPRLLQEEQEDLAIVEQWATYFAARDVSKRTKSIRSDGTFQPIDKALKESMTLMLKRWRANMWSQLRHDRIGQTSSFFFPTYLLLRVVERAHTCTTIERLSVVLAGEWTYLDQYGARLVQWLNEALTFYNRDIGEADDEDDAWETDDAADEEFPHPSMLLSSLKPTTPKRARTTTTTTRSPTKSRSVSRIPKSPSKPLRVRLRVAGPEKRPPPTGNSPKKVKKRRAGNKENEAENIFL